MLSAITWTYLSLNIYIYIVFKMYIIVYIYMYVYIYMTTQHALAFRCWTSKICHGCTHRETIDAAMTTSLIVNHLRVYVSII